MTGLKVSAIYTAAPDVPGLRGIQRLAGAILVQAIEDLRCGSSRRREDALRWIESDSSEQFAFVFCCRMLERDPQEIRRVLLQHAIPGWLISSLLKEAEAPTL